MSFSILPSVGDRVVVHGKHSGTVRFVGSVDYANGDDWCGIEMDESGIGKNNGTVKVLPPQKTISPVLIHNATSYLIPGPFSLWEYRLSSNV